jgi:hypothetical protein
LFFVWGDTPMIPLNLGISNDILKIGKICKNSFKSSLNKFYID